MIERGLAAAGRYLRFTVRCSDRPGQLAALLTLIGQQGANVDDVVHRRHDPRLRLGEVEVELSVETRGAEHSDRLVQALRRAGYEVQFGRCRRSGAEHLYTPAVQGLVDVSRRTARTTPR